MKKFQGIIAMKKNKITITPNALMILLSMMTTFVALMILFWWNKLYPFGENTLIFSDGVEYLGVYNYLSDTLTSSADVLYSWRAYMGEGAIPFIAFYGSHPLYYLFAILGNKPVALVHILTIFKIVSASGTFCFYLNTRKSGKDILKIFFSLNYALMSYVTIYIWNLTWLDGIVLMPIMFIGIKKIIEGKKAWTYIISLALAILFNFYIGYMMCFASVLFYIAFVMQEEHVVDRVKSSVFRYIAGSILAVGLVAFLLVPAVFGMPDSRKTDLYSMFIDMHSKFSYSELISMMFNGKASTQYMDTNLPLIYVGIVPFLFAILFFWNSNFTKRNRVVWLGVIITIALVFQNSFMDIIMHGGSINICFNYRYSFIFSFVIAVLGYNATVDLTVYKDKIYKILISIVLLLAFGLNGGVNGDAGRGYYLSVIIIAAVLALLYAYNNYGKEFKKLFFIIVPIFMVFDICTDAFYSLDGRMEESNKADVLTNRVVNGKSFAKDIAASDADFYRNIIQDDTINSDFIYGNNGITTYLSARNEDFCNSMSVFGFDVGSTAFYYGSNVPASVDAILGIKNISISEDISYKGYTITQDSRISNGQYYTNDYAMGLIYPVYGLVDTEGKDAFEFLQSVWQNIVSSANIGNVWEQNSDVTIVDTSEGAYLTISFTGTGYPQYITIGAEGIGYEYISESLTGGGSSNSSFNYLGTFAKGENVTMNFYADSLAAENIKLFYENTDIYRAIASELSYSNLDLTVKSSSDIYIKSFNATSDYVASSVPYGDQWKVYVDGSETQTYKNYNGFLAFGITPGTHDIELKYSPKGLAVGVSITCISAFIIVIMLVLGYFYRIGKLKWKR